MSIVDIDIQGSFPSLTVDFSRELQVVERILKEEVQKNFLEGGRPNRWQPKKDGKPSFLRLTGKLYQSLKTRRGNDFAEVYVSKRDVPYAFIQHFGGTTQPTVSAKSKRYFWWRWYMSKKQDEMWRRLALKDIGDKLRVKIPARPYMKLPPVAVKRIKEAVAQKFVITKSQRRTRKP